MKFLFFSSESEPPAGYYLMKLLVPVEEAFNERFYAQKYSKNMDNIAIIPICISQEMCAHMNVRERKYVSRIRKTADIRLKLEYYEFVHADESEKISMCVRIVQNAIDIVASKDSTFDKGAFMTDFLSIVSDIYHR